MPFDEASSVGSFLISIIGSYSLAIGTSFVFGVSLGLGISNAVISSKSELKNSWSSMKLPSGVTLARSIEY